MGELVNTVFEHAMPPEEILNLPARLSELNFNVLFQPILDTKTWKWSNPKIECIDLEEFWKEDVHTTIKSRFSTEDYPILEGPNDYVIFFNNPNVFTLNNGRKTTSYFGSKEVRNEILSNSMLLAQHFDLNCFVITGGIGEGNWPSEVDTDYNSIDQLIATSRKHNLYFELYETYRNNYKLIGQNIPEWIELNE